MSSEDAAPPLSPGQVLKERYFIERELGRGGFGAVYLARDQQLLSRQVVVKVLLGEASRDPWIQKKFRQELEALARIDHPGVVGVLDFGETPAGQAFLVMQFVEGVTLRSVIPAGGMDLARAAHIIRQIGQALDAAHEKGVVHRDLKPDNVMLLSPGHGEEHVKLIDFGIATVKHSRVAEDPESSKIAGSLAYMAPEQLMGKPSPASDVYSFGVIAYEMLTGQRPELLPQGIKTPPRELRPDLPEAAQQAIRKALAFHAEERYPSPRNFGEQLATALAASSPVAAAAAPRATRAVTERPAAPSAHGHVPSLEMAYVLFLDLVGYSILPMDRQTQTIQLLQEIVRDTPEFQRAQASDQLICLPTGDGMALVFFQNPVAPVQCAVEIARSLRNHPELRLRMGVHTGPVHRIADINTNRNVSGGGINLAQRVMDCGDAGHILISKTVADILGQLSDWAGYLHDLGEQEVKHGAKVHLVNLYTGEAGNPELPEKLRRRAAPQAVSTPAKSHRGLYMAAGASLTLVILVFAGTQVANWYRTSAGPKPAPEPQQTVQPPVQPSLRLPDPPPDVVQPPPKTKSSGDNKTAAPSVIADSAPPPPVKQEEPPPAPETRPAAPPAPSPNQDALQELQERFTLLAARVAGVRSGLQALQRKQQAAGLSLRSDMVAADQRVEYLLAQANTSLAAGDPDATKRHLDLAERSVETLERFLGR